MRREVDLREISDGRLYDINDMVKAGCDECRGCYACCCGMGDSIVLDPLDICRLAAALELTFEAMLAERLELNVVDGIILPNLKMTEEEERCTFLNEEGRCSIHGYRPGICRLFPLGRYYVNDGFRYFIQVNECRKEHRTKVKIRKWIDTPDSKEYEAFVTEWHYFLIKVQEQLTQVKDAKTVNLYILNTFFVMPYDQVEDFYGQFRRRLADARLQLGLYLKEI